MNNNVFELDTEINEKDFWNTFKRYYWLNHKNSKLSESDYYNRKENIGSFIYDHFFLKLYFKFKKKENRGLYIGFKKSVLQCHTDYFSCIHINKPKMDLSLRDFKISNFYNIINYEILVTKLFWNIKKVFEYDKKEQHNELSWTLTPWKYFWFAHRFDFLFNNFKYLNYRNWWLEFEKQKSDFLKQYKYYFEFDITNFYNNIDHKTFIKLLKTFFDRYSNFNWIEKFLLNFNDSLFKVNWYNKIWIPQWLLWSDILSTLFIWLILNNNKDYLWIKNNDWIYSVWNDIKIIYYADDFVIFWNNPHEINNFFNNKLKKLFNDYLLNFHGKWKDLFPLASWDYFLFPIDFNLLKKKDIPEIEKFSEELLKELKEDKIKVDVLKRYYSWIYSLKNLPKGDYKKILQELKLILFTDNYIKNDFVRAHLICLLQSLSIKHYLFLITELLENKIIKEKILVNFYKNYWYLFSWWTKETFYYYLNINAYLQNFHISLLESGFFDSTSFILWMPSELLKIEIEKQWLDEMNKLLYSRTTLEQYNENILWIKFSSIFKIDKNLTLWLTKFIYDTQNKHLQKLAIDIIRILDSLILIKNIKPYFYLRDASFLADLYSLFNILLSLYSCLKYEKIIDINILWNETDNIWKIKKTDFTSFENYKNKNQKNKWSNILLVELDLSLDEIKYLLFYITKTRAEINHKEKNTEWKDKTNVFLKYRENEVFWFSINDAISTIFILIQKELCKHKSEK